MYNNNMAAVQNFPISLHFSSDNKQTTEVENTKYEDK
jgi:hypothetical protein